MEDFWGLVQRQTIGVILNRHIVNLNTHIVILNEVKDLKILRQASE